MSTLCKCDEPRRAECGRCYRVWCDRCDPCPSACCPFCDHGSSSGVLDDLEDRYHPREIEERAWDLGNERGHSAATWVFDGNTNEATYRAILAGWLMGDPEVCDMQPAPLSGEWAGESIPELVTESGLDYERLDSDEARDWNDEDTWCEAFESAYSEAFWAEVERACLYHLGALAVAAIREEVGA